LARIFGVLEKFGVAPGGYLLKTLNIRALHKNIPSALFLRAPLRNTKNTISKILFESFCMEKEVRLWILH